MESNPGGSISRFNNGVLIQIQHRVALVHRADIAQP